MQQPLTSKAPLRAKSVITAMALALVALVVVPVTSTPPGAQAEPRQAQLHPFVRRAKELPAYPIAGGKGRATLLFDLASGSPDTAMTVLELDPGAAVPSHVHEGSHELLYVMDGQAEMMIDGETLALGPGDAVRIPMGRRHEARVVGDKTLRGVQIYSPAGPEQRFVPRP